MIGGLTLIKTKNLLDDHTFGKYRVSQKKGGLVFWAQFRGLNVLKPKIGRKQTPFKIKLKMFYIIGSWLIGSSMAMIKECF